MNKYDAAKLYSMEELLPVVAELTDQYTSKESSSVTYERARQLMEAVLYCIAHADFENAALFTGSLPPAKEVYRIGYAAVVREVNAAREEYNRLMTFFDSYGNRNYRDTVEKALPGFFLYYDVKFAPTDHIITLDYPVFGLDMTLEGIDRIAQYIEAVRQEQVFLHRFLREDILEKLVLFHPKYENEFFNLREIVESES